MELGKIRIQKKILSEFFENKTNFFSLIKTIVVDNVDTEVLAQYLVHNLRRKTWALIRSIP